MKEEQRHSFSTFKLLLIAFSLFVGAALLADSPRQIAAGLYKIFTSRSVLATDYIAVGGIGASLVNAALSGFASVWMLYRTGARLNGANLMAVWLTVGFSFFGKNLLNMAPILFGVWLYARFQREPFHSYSLVALLSSTLAPVVSEIAFGRPDSLLISLPLGLLLGVTVGFFIPIISAATNRVHGGYNLYNLGFAGGIIAIFLVAFRESVGIQTQPVSLVSRGNDLFLAVFLYGIMLLWGLFSLLGGSFRDILPIQKKIMRHSGRLVTDYFILYHENAFLNMALLGILGTTITLLLGAPLNGISMAGIFTMMAFGAFGKHPRNCLPVMTGAVLYAFINEASPTDPGNICAILFCTGLAPIAGQYGVGWGVLAGILHTALVFHAGQLTDGLNLYNNGFAAGFVALVLVPIIVAFRKGRTVS